MLTNFLIPNNNLNPQKCLVIVRENTVLESILVPYVNKFIGRDTFKSISVEDIEYIKEFQNFEVYYSPWGEMYDGEVCLKRNDKLLLRGFPLLKIFVGKTPTGFHDSCENFTDFYRVFYGDKAEEIIKKDFPIYRSKLWMG